VVGAPPPPSDQNHTIFSPSVSYRTTYLPSASNNNKVVRSNNNNNSTTSSIQSVSRKSLYSVKNCRTSPSLPPLDKSSSPRTRNGNTLPSSRTGSSKLSRIEVKSSKRSRSATEDNVIQLNKDELHTGRAQQITQTVRVLRARSALLLPSPQLNLAPPTSQPLQIHPLILKSEERKKRR